VRRSATEAAPEDQRRPAGGHAIRGDENPGLRGSYQTNRIEKEQAMSATSAVIELHIPADPTVTERRENVRAVIRRLVTRPRSSQERSYLHIGGSYPIPDGRRAYARELNWVHTHH
jgi:hypothetical protein